MIKICLTGPESTGKTTLCNELAKIFDCATSPEYAREYLGTSTSYQVDELRIMAEGQLAKHQEAIDAGQSLVLFDTGVEVIQIWSEFKFGKCDPWIVQQHLNSDINLYLLCAPDIPWTYDCLRENPQHSDTLFEAFEALLSNTEKRYVIIQGSGSQRRINAESAIRTYLQNLD